MFDYAHVMSHLPLMQHALDVLLHRDPLQSLGDPRIDFQERALLALVDEVDVLCEGDPSLADVRRVATRAIRLLRAHFSVEEQMLSGIGYPRLQAHAAEHREILEDADALRRRLDRRGQQESVDSLTRSLFTFLLGVTMGHVTVGDGDWARFLAEQWGNDSTGCA
jgi:hemerythrin-like metal-binding protein